MHLLLIADLAGGVYSSHICYPSGGWKEAKTTAQVTKTCKYSAADSKLKSSAPTGTNLFICAVYLGLHYYTLDV